MGSPERNKKSKRRNNLCKHKWVAGKRPGEPSLCTKCMCEADALFIPTSRELVLRFQSIDAAHHFKAMMCDGGGEQHPAFDCFTFDYHHGNTVLVSGRPHEDEGSFDGD